MERVVAVVGGGVSGLVCAYTLAKHGVHVVLYEREDYLGGHARTVSADGIDLDLGFMVCNRVTYSNTMEFLEELGVDLELSEMSFAVSVDDGNGRCCEWASANGLSGLFAQKKNALSTGFWRMVYEITQFKNHVFRYLDNVKNSDSAAAKETLGHFIKSNGYSKEFCEFYLIPMCASIWSCSSEQVMGFSAFYVLSFCRNHHLLQIFGRPQWLTIKGRSRTYVDKVAKELEERGCEIKIGCSVQRVSTVKQGVLVEANGVEEIYDKCIICAHAPDALQMLGIDATFEERRILGAYQYVYSDIYLHRDKELMPKNSAAWSAWNFLGSQDNHVCVTYWLNTLQNLGNTGRPYLVTLNPPHTPKEKIIMWTTSHPVPSPAAFEASNQFHGIQGKRGIWFCGAYQGYGFHEDGVKAGLHAANGVLGLSKDLLADKMQMWPTWSEAGCRLLVLNFLKQFIQTGYLYLHEDGGTVLHFEGKNKGCNKKAVLRIHKPAFYWKVATRMDLGLADSYIDGDFTFTDRKDGLLNMFMIFIANRDTDTFDKKHYRRGWWTPMIPTALYGSALSFIRHISRSNSLTQARRNISQHYDLSNDMFSLFLDETMTYSCAIFKEPEEPLIDAQRRKISLLIKKVHIDSKHEVLEIGCGWGSLAIEVVRFTGCKYTGITLSREQLKFAQKRVKEAGLEDHITLLLCDYREIPKIRKYNRIISCEMLEAVGHEYLEEFFDICENILRDDGILVLQFISIPDKRYDEYRRSSDFIKEYIFPGGCLPSFSRVTSAMANASNLCVEHTENIGRHYYYTLLQWRENFQSHQSDLIKLGFGEEFIKTWDYYFVYCAAGFRTLTLLNYQVVFSRPGNVKALWKNQNVNL